MTTPAVAVVDGLAHVGICGVSNPTVRDLDIRLVVPYVYTSFATWKVVVDLDCRLVGDLIYVESGVVEHAIKACLPYALYDSLNDRGESAADLP